MYNKSLSGVQDDSTDEEDNSFKIITISRPNAKLYSVPGNILGMKSLKSLTMNDNCISDISLICESLTKLRNLNLYGNRICWIPKSIKNLTKLTTLDLSDNLITTLPSEMKELNCVEIHLDLNKITYLPISLAEKHFRLSESSYENLDNLDQECEYLSIDYLKKPLTNLPTGLKVLRLFNPIVSFDKVKIPFGCKVIT